jgi:toxin-antitoxin system PIN domain toxin
VTAYLCDTNIWLALLLSAHVHHDAVRKWLDSVEEPLSVLFCRLTQQSLLRLLTSAPVFAPYGNQPLSNDEAWATYQALVADERIEFRTYEPEGLDTFWHQYASRRTASPKVWADAYLAAYARAEPCVLVTTDRDFQQYAGLDLRLLG